MPVQKMLGELCSLWFSWRDLLGSTFTSFGVMYEKGHTGQNVRVIVKNAM